MARLCEVEKLVAVGPPGGVLEEEGDEKFERREDIEEVSRFHREKVERSAGIREKF